MIFNHTPVSFIKDLKRFLCITKLRQSHFDSAPATCPVGQTGANKLEKELHPCVQKMVFNGFSSVNNSATASLSGEKAAFFKTGQSVNLLTGGAVIPCFIVSSPALSYEGKYVISLDDRRAYDYLKNLGEGSEVAVSQPVGTFYYQPLRDGNNIGIIYGENCGNIALTIKKEIEEQFSGVTVSFDGTAEKSAVYVIGTHEFIASRPEFINGRKVRALETPFTGGERPHKEYSCRIINGETGKTVMVYADETLESAFEKNGFGTAVKCRDGECGFCRCRLVSGSVTTVDTSYCGGKRSADDKFGYIHPCRCFPDSDITVKF